MKEAEKICSGRTGYKTCHAGQLLEDQCPPGAECVQSTVVTDVVCRVHNHAPIEGHNSPLHLRRR
jgi:hypothetical protein